MKRMKTFVPAVVVAIFVWVSASVLDPALAAPGNLDPSFGNSGIVPAPVFPPLPNLNPGYTYTYTGYPSGIAAQADGTTLVIFDVIQCGFGPLVPGACFSSYGAVARYNGDGSIDSSFGTSGIAAGPFMGPTPAYQLYAFLVQADGKIVLASAISSGYVLSRLNVNGTLDTTFGSQGVVPLPSTILNGNTYVFSPLALAQQLDGKLLVSGNYTGGSSVLRLTTDGVTDTSYGQSGIAPLAVAIYAESNVSQTVMTVQPDGKLLIAAGTTGDSQSYPSPSSPLSIFVERVNMDGTPDVSFGGGNGVTTLAFTNTPLQFLATISPVSIFVQPNGELLIAGMQNAPTDQVGQFALVQLTANGDYDTTFGSGGRLTSAAAGYLNAASAVQQSDGKIIFSGTTPSPLGPSYGNITLVSRLNPDGSLDPQFGSCGAVQFPGPEQPAPPVQAIAPLALQADGKILFGNPSVAPGLIRLLGGNSTVVSAASNANPAPVGLPVSLIASGAGGSPLTGTFTITDFGVPITGCTSLPVTVPACLVVLGVGVHSIDATYNGDTQNPAASSCPITQYVDPAGLTTTVEYLHAVFNDYFITNNPAEVEALDGSLVWRRTGQHFFVHPLDQLDGSAPVCRFWSGQTYAPQSTHFFTSDAAECATLMQSTVWIYEGTVFGLAAPSTEGDCPAGTQPLYRLYNNGQGGAPNHRYLTNSQQWGMMIKFYGWIPEGAGVGVIGCV